jgi:hypothetical protein
VSKLGGDDVLFVPDAAGADAIVADDTAIYWMDHGGGSGAGAIKRADLATGAVTTLADGLGFDGLGTFALAGDADYLYFPEPKKNRLYRISKTDGTPSALATSVLNPTAIALDDSNVYIASQGSVYNNGTSYTIQSVSKTGSGNPLTLVSQTINSDVAGLVVDAQYVWFSTRADGEVDRVSKYGGSYGYPATSGSGSPYSQ